MNSNARPFVCHCQYDASALERAPAQVERLARSCITITAGITLALLISGGCVPVPRDSNPLHLRFMSTEHLREYSEQVFREQNRTTTRLMMASMEDDSVSAEQQRRIDQTETRMNDACASLNRIASARARGQDTGLALENEVRRNVRKCARETEKLKALLDELEIGDYQ